MRLPSVLLALLLVPLPAAAEEAADQHVYLEAEGWLAAGVVATGVEPVSRASFVVTPVDGFHRLRFALDFAPEGAALETPAADALVRYRFQLDVRDNATGDALASFRYDAPGLAVLEVEGEAPLRLELTLVHGADVQYALRVNALPDPQPL